MPWLGAGTTIGLTGSGVVLLLLVRRFRGPGALRGWTRAAIAGLAGALAGTAAGLTVAIGLPVSGFLPNVGVSLLASAAVLAAFLAVAVLTGAIRLWQVLALAVAFGALTAVDNPARQAFVQ